MVYLLKMVIFYSYMKLPEGIYIYRTGEVYKQQTELTGTTHRGFLYRRWDQLTGS